MAQNIAYFRSVKARSVLELPQLIGEPEEQADGVGRGEGGLRMSNSSGTAKTRTG